MKNIIIASGIISAVVILMIIVTIRKTDSSHKSINNQNTITVTDTSKGVTSTSISSKKYSQTKEKHTTKITVTSAYRSDPVTETPTLTEPPSETQPQTVPTDPQPEPVPVEPHVDIQPQPVPPQQQPAPQPEPVSPCDSQTQFQAEILALVNNERRAAGVPELTADVLLNQAAQIRAEETVDTFSHTRPDGQSCFSIFDQLGISATTEGENIAGGSSTAADVMNQWMNSDGHRQNILNPSFKSLGVGFVETSSGYKCYWTQLFAG